MTLRFLVLATALVSVTLNPAAASMRPSPDSPASLDSNPPASGKITILLAYTTEAARQVGGPRYIQENAESSLRMLNEALRNSGIAYQATFAPHYAYVEGTGSLTADVITELGNTSALRITPVRTSSPAVLMFRSTPEELQGPHWNETFRDARKLIATLSRS
ncbi:MAG: hypothetical protein AAF624_17865 [Bacteroidota bacterium]